MHMDTSHVTPNIMSFLPSPTFSLCWRSFKAAFTIPYVSSLGHLRENLDLYVSGLLSAVPVWSKESCVMQTKGKKHLGRPKQTSHFTAVSPLWLIISRAWWFTIKQTMNPVWQSSSSLCTVNLHTGNCHSRTHYGTWKHHCNQCSNCKCVLRK